MSRQIYTLILEGEKHRIEKYLLSPLAGEELIGRESYSPRLAPYKPEMGSELHVGTQCLVAGHTLNLKWNIFAQRDEKFLCKRWK